MVAFVGYRRGRAKWIFAARLRGLWLKQGGRVLRRATEEEAKALHEIEPRARAILLAKVEALLESRSASPQAPVQNDVQNPEVHAQALPVVSNGAEAAPLSPAASAPPSQGDGVQKPKRERKAVR